MNRILEIRTYTLQPGSGARFHALIEEQSVPLLQAAGMDVVRYGQSVQDPDQYYLMRAYDDLAHLEASQASFYGSAAWREGPREAVVAAIVHSINSVLWLTSEVIDALRHS